MGRRIEKIKSIFQNPWPAADCRSSQVFRPSALMAAAWLTTLISVAAGVEQAMGEQHNAQSQPAPNTFQLPQYTVAQNSLARPALRLLRRRKFTEAEDALRRLVKSNPNWPTHHALLAAALAHQGNSGPALKSLGAAIQLGFSHVESLRRDVLFSPLHGKPDFEALLQEMNRQKDSPSSKNRRRVTSSPVKNGSALVSESNSMFDSRILQVLSGFHFPLPDKPAKVYGGSNQPLAKLNRWHEKGLAAGNYGDLYDNRDKGHSALRSEDFPQLSHVRYSDKAQAAGLNYGLNSTLLFNAITLGNSSTANTGSNMWRSQARMMLTRPGLPARAYLQYSNNHLYIYPEHKDHDTKHGDLFPANTPYMIITQGSSGSDQPFLKAVSAILAAFRPDVKNWLRGRKLISPTVQMIFRSGMKPVRTIDDYLSARAHPTVFKAADIDIEKMIQLARDFRADVAPPSVRFNVVGERRPNPGIDYFGPSNRDETLINTPSAIARVVRSTAHERHMTVDASKTTDPNGKPLRFLWKILRGNTENISIKPLTSNHSKVEIRIKWHLPRVVPYALKLTTNRVDIAAFAYNGDQYSAPAFVSFYYPPNQLRAYNENGQIARIIYDPDQLSKPYVDPLLFARRAWQDTYKYTHRGLLIGWQRQSGKNIFRFTRHGAKVLAVDGKRRPIRAERLSYQIRRSGELERHVRPVPTKMFVHYIYATSTDALGQARFCNQTVCNHH